MAECRSLSFYEHLSDEELVRLQQETLDYYHDAADQAEDLRLVYIGLLNISQSRYAGLRFNPETHPRLFVRLNAYFGIDHPSRTNE